MSLLESMKEIGHEKPTYATLYPDFKNNLEEEKLVTDIPY